jgi:hypothetical protein
MKGEARWNIEIKKHDVGYCDHCDRAVERGGDWFRSFADGNEFTTYDC